MYIYYVTHCFGTIVSFLPQSTSAILRRLISSEYLHTGRAFCGLSYLHHSIKYISLTIEPESDLKKSFNISQANKAAFGLSINSI